MKLLDQYLYAIRKKLPKDGKDEILKELESSLLDSMESSYGPNPTEVEIKETIKAFGSPSSVAVEYGRSKYVINPELTDLYFMISKIIIFALLGAFSIIFIIKLFSDTGSDLNVPIELVSIISNTLGSSLSAIGWVTIAFALISRFSGSKNFSDDWNPDDLEELPSKKESVSIIGSIFGLFFIMVAIVIFNLYPSLINVPTKTFIRAGFNMIHTIDLEVFKSYLLILNVLWFVEIIYIILTLITMKITKSLKIFRIILDGSGIVFLTMLYTNESLYNGPFNHYGIRALWLLLIILSTIEVITQLFRLVWKK